MALLDIQVPDIGDFDEVAVIELLVKPGDTIRAEQSLITVESDKASMEIPSSHAGVVKEVKVKLGDKVKQGSVVVVLDGEVAATSAVIATATPASGLAATEAKQSTAPQTGLPRADGPRNDRSGRLLRFCHCEPACGRGSRTDSRRRSALAFEHQNDRALLDLVAQLDFQLFHHASVAARNFHGGLVALHGD